MRTSIIMTLTLLLSAFTYTMAQPCINDTTPPTAACNNLSISLDATGNATVTAQDIGSASSDNCGIQSLLINNLNAMTFDCSNIGTSPAILTVTDSSGNSGTCLSTITVMDTATPIIVCSDTTISTSDSTVTISSQGLSIATDNCAIASLTFSNQSTNMTLPNTPPSSTQQLTVIAIDAYGNTATCVSNVTLNLTNNTHKIKKESIQLTIAPNPSTGIIQLNATTLIEQINVYNLTGQTVYTSDPILQNTTTLNLGKLPAGQYIVECSTKDGLEQQKIVLSK